MISAKIIADSQNIHGTRITTFLLTYPRFIHSEFMTHRMFSRNASSSRAIPFKKQLKAVLTDMAMPVFWGLNQKGMQAAVQAKGFKLALAKCLWKGSGYIACGLAYLFDKCGIHKQLTNRIIEPWSHITVVVTSTQYANFFGLRYHPMAQPEIMTLAIKMFEEYQKSRPLLKYPGEWHLPFVDDFRNVAQGKAYRGDELMKSVASCARTSYNNHDGTNSTAKEDVALVKRLIESQPIHASPCEHQACVAYTSDEVSGNFHGGWIQFRKMLENEVIHKFVPGMYDHKNKA